MPSGEQASSHLAKTVPKIDLYCGIAKKNLKLVVP